ncbi:MAG: TVP38/TMEM64 family protein [Actinobacteria bacterium]|nr:MAG: TVP38/TMEM64 family protein [Actinomycetota bacterium]
MGGRARCVRPDHLHRSGGRAELRIRPDPGPRWRGGPRVRYRRGDRRGRGRRCLLGHGPPADRPAPRGRGFWAVLYLRLIPALPFNSLNYAAGLSRLRARHMFAGTGLGFAPRTFAYAAVGGSISNIGSAEAIVAISIGVVMAVIGALLARGQIAAERRRTSA